MRPMYQAELVNKTFGDPGVYIDLKFQRRALLFDIGDVSTLPARKLLRISDIFVSHTHMDHFAGFDYLLRVCLGRDRGVSLYGPANFISQLEHKLSAYTWNLVENYATDFVVVAHELEESGRVLRAQFRSRNQFRWEPLDEFITQDGVLLEDSQFRVRTIPLEHHDIVSLAFAFEESTHINVWKNRLDELRLPTGQWLTELKRLVRAGAPDETPVRIHWRTREGSREETFPLGELKRKVLELVPGQKVCYVTDVAGHERNTQALVQFVQGADVLFIEAVFLDEDREQIARMARVKSAVPFHFSSRYLGRDEELRTEFTRAWQEEATSP
jgi:ribonuclease Z